MDSKRNVYFKKYLGKKLSNPSTRDNSKENPQEVSRKRPKQSNPDFVTKLRRANTADYDSIQSQDNTSCLVDDNLDSETTLFTRNDVPSQHSSLPILLPPVLETNPSDDMSSQHTMAHILSQPALETCNLDEIRIQHTPESMLIQSTTYTGLDTNATGNMTDQSMSSLELLEQHVLETDADKISAQHIPACMVLQPAIDSSAPDDMSTQNALTPLLQLGTLTSASDETSTSHTPALKSMAPDEVMTQQIPGSDLLQSAIESSAPDLLLQPTPESESTLPTQITPSLMHLKPTEETDASSNLTTHDIPGPQTNQIQSLSREEEIEICLNQIRADDEECIDGKQVSRITIELEEETKPIPEKENNLNTKNILNIEGKLDSSKVTSESCKKTRSLKQSKDIVQTRSKIKIAKANSNIIKKPKPGSSTKTEKHRNEQSLTMEKTIVEENSENVSEKKPESSRRISAKHVDFLSSDEEIFTLTSSSWDESDESDESDDTDSDSLDHEKNTSNKKGKNQRKKKKQVKRRKKVTEKLSLSKEDSDTNQQTGNESMDQTNSRRKKKRTNKNKERSILKKTGKEYVTKKGKVVRAKTLQANPCAPKNCPNNCYDISEERRKGIFEHYWSLSSERRRDWIISHTKREIVKRKRTKDVESRRKFTNSYFINEGEGNKSVCLKFMLKTLDVRQRFLYLAISTSQEGTSNIDKRGRGVPANKTPPSLMQSVRDYIQQLPAVPSHYCRKNSKKCYLPQEYRNLSNLYKIYKQKNITDEKSFVGEKVFRNVFLTEFNISFHIPRKDKCCKCIKYENSPGEFQQEKEMHMTDKEETYSRFGIHQALRELNNNVLCTTFDLQKVLNTPYGQSMLLYYSRKIATYNLTFYESITREGFCFLWNEVEGKRGANEICTILAKYIQKVDERKSIQHLLLYCDACPGQNRNKIVLACIHKCLQRCKNITTIQINYLLPGHTFMPVDSMHSVIEKSVTNTIVWAPSQWPTVCALARKSPKPYEVEILYHEDFEGWDVISEKYFKGNLTGKISKIRIATFKKNRTNHVEVKYSMNIDAETENVEVLGKTEVMPKKIYYSKLPISKKKFSDLEKLCNNKTIPALYIPEYKSLPHAANVQDVLPDTDIEDVQD